MYAKYRGFTDLTEPDDEYALQAGPGTAEVSHRSKWDTENALRTSEQRYHDIVDHSPDLILVARDQCVTFVNSAGIRMLRVASEAEVLGRSLLEFIHPEYREAAAECVAKLVPGPAASPAHLSKLVAADGTEVDVEVFATSFYAEGHLDIQAVCRDVTEQRAGEAAVRESEERFRLLSRATNDAIWDWDVLTGALWWNDGFESIFGFQRDDMKSTIDTWKQRIHPDDRAWVIADIYGAIERGEEHWSATYRFTRRDGSYAHVQDRGQVIRDESGRAVRMVGGMTDRTERLVLEEQLHAAQRLDALGQLTGGVAHDFNNLLTVILGNAEGLAEELPEDPAKRALAEAIAGAAQRGADLTQRLLSFSRRQALAPQAVDVGDLLGEAEGLLRRTLGEHVEIEFVPPPRSAAGGAWLALVDRCQLESALLNLCLNARDAMPTGGRLTIEMSHAVLDEAYAQQHEEVSPGDYVMLAVSDTGCGIVPANLTKVFEPFFTTKEKGKGTGLGLAMVYGFMKQSGGHISVYSEPGHGTAVRLYLPRAPAGAGARERLEAVPASFRGTGKVLLVEDDALVRRYARQQLSSLGYEVVEAESGPRALEILREGQDVVVLFTDVVMPGGMTGAQLADEARKLRPKLPVLYCSGYTETTVLRNACLEGGVTMLAKPYRRADLARKLTDVLGRGPG